MVVLIVQVETIKYWYLWFKKKLVGVITLNVTKSADFVDCSCFDVPNTYIISILHPYYRLIGLVGRVFANGPGDQDSVLGRIIPKT